jgi:hypothetical protein
MQPLPQKPLVLAMMLCDQFYRDRTSRNLSLLGCFNSLGSAKFPVHHVDLGVYLAITDCAGPVTVQFRVIDEDEVRPPLVTGEATVEIPDPRRVQDFVMNFREIVFPSPGEYRVQAFCNGEFLIERRLSVTLGVTPRR